MEEVDLENQKSFLAQGNTTWSSFEEMLSSTEKRASIQYMDTVSCEKHGTGNVCIKNPWRHNRLHKSIVMCSSKNTSAISGDHFHLSFVKQTNAWAELCTLVGKVFSRTFIMFAADLSGIKLLMLVT